MISKSPSYSISGAGAKDKYSLFVKQNLCGGFCYVGR